MKRWFEQGYDGGFYTSRRQARQRRRRVVLSLCGVVLAMALIVLMIPAERPPPVDGVQRAAPAGEALPHGSTRLPPMLTAEKPAPEPELAAAPAPAGDPVIPAAPQAPDTDAAAELPAAVAGTVPAAAEADGAAEEHVAPAPTPAPQPARPAPEPQIVPPAPRKASARIQLAAVGSPRDAARAWRQLQEAQPDLLGKLKPRVQKAEAPRHGTVWRVQAEAPSDTRAKRLCDELQRRRVDCFVVRG